MFAAISCTWRSVPGARRLTRLFRANTRLALGRTRSKSNQSPTVASMPGGMVSSMPSPRELEAAAMHRDDPYRGRSVQCVGVDLLGEEGPPAERLDRRQGAASCGCVSAAGQKGRVVADHGGVTIPEDGGP